MDFRATIGGDISLSASFAITDEEGRELSSYYPNRLLEIGPGMAGVTFTLEGSTLQNVPAYADNTRLSSRDGLYLSLAGGNGTADFTGGTASDILIGGDQDDTLAGGAGADRLTGNGGSDVFSGASAELDGDTITDFSADDRIVVTDAGAGATVLYDAGQLIVDLDGAGGNDAISIIIQNQTAGSYSIENGEITFTLDTPSGPPNAIGGTDGDDWLGGTDGVDDIDAGAGNDTVYAGGGNDSVLGGTGDDVIGGGLGYDLVIGGEGNDTVFGGEGHDTLFGNAGDDVIWSGLGNDRVKGASGQDVIGGGEGNDTLYGGSGIDTIYGGDGSDEIHGEAGRDMIYGGLGDDLLIGGSGVDFLYGGAGNDTLVASDFGEFEVDADGRNVLNGGRGNDNLVGATGQDVFVFGVDEGDDDIDGFQTGGVDKIDLRGQTWTLGYVGDHTTMIVLSGGGTIVLSEMYGDSPGEPEDDWFL